MWSPNKDDAQCVRLLFLFNAVLVMVKDSLDMKNTPVMNAVVKGLFRNRKSNKERIYKQTRLGESHGRYYLCR